MWSLLLFHVLRRLQDRTVLTELPIIHSLINLLSGGFMSFAKIKYKFLKWFTRSLNVYDPYQGIWLFCLLFILSLKGFEWSFRQVWMRGILTSHILLSQKPDPRRCKSYTLIKMCKCVEYFPIPNIFGTPLIMIFSLLINCLGSMG